MTRHILTVGRLGPWTSADAGGDGAPEAKAREWVDRPATHRTAPSTATYSLKGEAIPSPIDSVAGGTLGGTWGCVRGAVLRPPFPRC